MRDVREHKAGLLTLLLGASHGVASSHGATDMGTARLQCDDFGRMKTWPSDLDATSLLLSQILHR